MSFAIFYNYNLIIFLTMTGKLQIHRLRSSYSVKLFVVDRVRDFIGLYVDHQSAWVPASKVEQEILQRRSEIIDTIPRISSIEQVAVLEDRMLPCCCFRK
jgi:hypothetical protein